MTPALIAHFQTRLCDLETDSACGDDALRSLSPHLQLRRLRLCVATPCADGRRFGDVCFCNQAKPGDAVVGSACDRRGEPLLPRPAARCARLTGLRGCAVLNGVSVDASALTTLRSVDAAVQAIADTALRERLCWARVQRCAADVGVRVAFFLMLHNTRHTWASNDVADQEPSTGLQLFRWLMEHVWHANHTFAIHVDAGAPRAWLANVLEYLDDARFAANVFLMPQARSVVWSSIDVAQAALDGVRFLLGRSEREWDFFINLSGTDVALMRPEQLQRYLAERRGLNMLWANYFDSINARQRATHIDATFAVCAERQRVVKTRYVKQEALWFMPVKGQFWMTLTREFCEHVWSDSAQLQRATRFLGLSHVPDEKLFPSLLLASPFRHTWLRVMDRYIEWESQANHPTVLQYPQHWAKLTSGAFTFGRKVSFTHSKELLARLFARLQQQSGVE